MPYERSGGKQCVIVGCHNNQKKIYIWKNSVCDEHSEKHEDCPCLMPFHFHCIPKDTERRRLWLRAINRKGFDPCGKELVCSIHFVDGKPTKENPCPTQLLGHDKKVQLGKRKITGISPVNVETDIVPEITDDSLSDMPGYAAICTEDSAEPVSKEISCGTEPVVCCCGGQVKPTGRKMAATRENVELWADNCFIHFNGCPDDQNLLNFTKVRWKKVIECADEWVGLDCPEKLIAEKMHSSLKNTEHIEDQLQGHVYHDLCYKNFAGVRRIERARKRHIKLHSIPEPFHEVAIQTDIDKPMRLRSSMHNSCQSCTPVLSHPCTICKQNDGFVPVKQKQVRDKHSETKSARTQVSGNSKDESLDMDTDVKVPSSYKVASNNKGSAIMSIETAPTHLSAGSVECAPPRRVSLVNCTLSIKSDTDQILPYMDWVVKREKNGDIRLIKLAETTDTLLCKVVITVSKAEPYLNIIVHQKEIPNPTHDIYSKYGGKPLSYKDIGKMVEEINSYGICIGNPDPEFKTSYPKDGSACIETDFGEKFYQSTIRSAKCHLLFNAGPRCPNCCSLRISLKITAPRKRRKTDNLEDPSIPLLHLSHEQLRNRLRTISRENECLKEINCQFSMALASVKQSDSINTEWEGINSIKETSMKGIQDSTTVIPSIVLDNIKQERFETDINNSSSPEEGFLNPIEEDSGEFCSLLNDTETVVKEESWNDMSVENTNMFVASELNLLCSDDEESFDQDCTGVR